MRTQTRILTYSLVSMLALGSGGCATQQATSGAAAPQQAQAAAEEKAHYFLVFHENGRIYAFSDPALYRLFLEHNEVPLTRTRIGGGPAGETVVIGLTKNDAKLTPDKPTQTELFYDDKIGAVGPFYGEVIYNGRYYVFGEWQDMKSFLQHKEAPWTYTEIGTGPKGETVIYVLNKKTKDLGRPAALVEAFQKMHQKK